MERNVPQCVLERMRKCNFYEHLKCRCSGQRIIKLCNTPKIKHRPGVVTPDMGNVM